MTPQEFDARIQENSRPLIVEFSAAWCMPCRMMAPHLKKVSQEYADKVDTLLIDADESGELLAHLGVLGVPTLMGYASGRRIFQQAGAQNAGTLRRFYETVLGNRAWSNEPSPTDRMLRTLSGLAFLAFWYFSGSHWGFLLLGGGLLFSAFYDRCPIYHALAPRILNWLSGPRSQDSST